MPTIAVSIEWDVPDEQYWLNADNVALALQAYCPNTRFIVRNAAEHDDEADTATCTRCDIGDAYEGGLCWDCLDG